MFIIVSAPMRMNIAKRIEASQLSARVSAMKMETLSNKVPCMNKVYMDSATDEKYFLPNSVAENNCVNVTENTYITTINRKSVKKTDLRAAVIALSNVMSSGIARRSRATRAMRASRNSRIKRKSDESLEKLPAACMPTSEVTMLITQVSTTVIATNVESNTNHRSLNPLHFFSKAPKRIIHSNKKKAQKRCWANWKPKSASVRTSSPL
mmetsp:Transcript_124087/g.310176  ORF Transcript_124087/g.310176 Transcript_124087/m.310176 type:complete len:209 (-) Transcript_124087:710-1336(-)